MGAAAALQQLAVCQGLQQNNIFGNHPPEKTMKHPLAMEGQLVIGRAKEGGSATTTDSRLRQIHTCKRTATASCPPQGLSPVHISNTTQPRLQISILELYPFFSPSMASGAIQVTDPCIEVRSSIALMSSVRFEVPKLAILQTPSVPTRILSAFRF
jgi:hypothetical protein